MHELVEPNAWVALRLPSETTKVLQVTPNTTISLGKYGSFPSNLIIHRPYHLTYEIQDKAEGESYSRLRIVPAAELHADALADEQKQQGGNGGSSSAEDDTPVPSDAVFSAVDGVEYTLVDPDTGAVVVRSNRETIDDGARQTLTTEEIEELKRDGAGAGKGIIAKLMLAHTGLDEKTRFSLAKYKLLKTKKYIRRFAVLPLDPLRLGTHWLEDRDASKTLEMREEMVALVGCWGNVHFGGEDRFLEGPLDVRETRAVEAPASGDAGEQHEEAAGPDGGRWLVVDDTGGLLVAAMAERMGFLYPTPASPPEKEAATGAGEDAGSETIQQADNTVGPAQDTTTDAKASAPQTTRHKTVPRPDDFAVPYSLTNTLTLIHSHNQANLTLLNNYGYDSTSPNLPPEHPLTSHLLPLSWLQLLQPGLCNTYASAPAESTPEEVATWKPARRGHYHRKRRRWARTRHIVDTARRGGFSGLVVASQMDPVSVLRHTLPLLAGGAPVAVYSPTVEPLAELADCFTVGRRAAWAGGDRPASAEGKTVEELERWEGSDEFPINPTLLLGAAVQTSRARKWQVLPGRTHPLMTGRGGSEGYVFTGWRAKPAEGKIEARGKFKRRKVEATAGGEV